MEQAVHPLDDDDDACMRVPNGFCFPHMVYNMAVAPCRLEDISDMLDLKTNERLNEAKRLHHAAFE